MNTNTLLYIILGMIFYDFSIHLIYFFKKEQFFLKRRMNYWPDWTGHKYQVFWALFWGSAFIMLLLYVFLK